MRAIFRRAAIGGVVPALLLAGCAGGGSSADGYGKHATSKKSGNGLVVFRMRGNDLKRVPVRLYWRAFNKNDKQPVSPQRWFEMKHKGNDIPPGFARNSKHFDRYQVKVATAGYYYLDNMRVREPYDSGPKKISGGTVYFTVRPGQAVYVGDFKIDYDERRPEFRLTDDFARAKQFMAKRRDIGLPLRHGTAQRIQIETSSGD